MKKQLLTLQQLIGVMDPELYRHLGLPIPHCLVVPALLIMTGHQITQTGSTFSSVFGMSQLSQELKVIELLFPAGCSSHSNESFLLTMSCVYGRSCGLTITATNLSSSSPLLSWSPIEM